MIVQALKAATFTSLMLFANRETYGSYRSGEVRFTWTNL
jgi:hypothetical protein